MEENLRKVRKGKMISNEGCPAWANTNLFSGVLAHVGQT
jgi:hypothetical protein